MLARAASLEGGESKADHAGAQERPEKRANTGVAPSVARVRIIQVTDVYKLDNFAKLKTLIAEKKAEHAKESPLSNYVRNKNCLLEDQFATFFFNFQ